MHVMAVFPRLPARCDRRCERAPDRTARGNGRGRPSGRPAPIRRSCILPPAAAGRDASVLDAPAEVGDDAPPIDDAGDAARRARPDRSRRFPRARNADGRRARGLVPAPGGLRAVPRGVQHARGAAPDLVGQPHVRGGARSALLRAAHHGQPGRPRRGLLLPALPRPHGHHHGARRRSHRRVADRLRQGRRHLPLLPRAGRSAEQARAPRTPTRPPSPRSPIGRTFYGNSAFVLDPNGLRRGPYPDAGALHPYTGSPVPPHREPLRDVPRRGQRGGGPRRRRLRLQRARAARAERRSHGAVPARAHLLGVEAVGVRQGRRRHGRALRRSRRHRRLHVRGLPHAARGREGLHLRGSAAGSGAPRLRRRVGVGARHRVAA